MIEIDTLLLKDLVKKISVALKKLEQNNTDIIHNFNELNKYWQDADALKFNSSSNLEIQRMLKLEENVRLQLDFYSYLEIEYKKIGNKIKCNLESKDFIELKLGEIIEQINSIINQYNDLGDYSFYDRSYIIDNQINDLNKLLNTFNNIRNNIKSKFERIQSIENDLSERLKDVEIQMFLLNNYESEA
jgi:hypothetical protein